MEANFSKEILHTAAEATKISYTIKHGDYKRINKKGILKVYNLREPIEIPVIRILGKWKETHLGVTISRLNEEWQIEGGLARNMNKPSFATKIKRKLFKYNPLFLFEKYMDRRMNEDNLLKDA